MGNEIGARGSLTPISYSVFVDSLLAALPEIKPQHDALQKDIGPDVLAYPAVELVLEPFVKDLLRANADPDILRRVFAFFEQMAQAQDTEVVNLLHVGIFESWAADAETLAKAWNYMGEATKRIASDAAHQSNLGD